MDGLRVTRLPDTLVNQIAAGEVLERPGAAVKELVENALDAGATRIVVRLTGGGIDRIEIEDDGHGMSPADLALAVERHCTSKLGHRDLSRIATLGFRGEALPSIGAAARLSIVSRARSPASSPAPNPEGAWRIAVEGGRITPPVPAAGPPGTRVLVEDLFYATPARRKFLKSPRVEADHAETLVKRLAIASPGVAWRMEIEGRVVLDRPSETLEGRVRATLGPDADTGMIVVSHRRETLALEGFALGPAASRATNSAQFLVVNGRPVTDPVLRTAVRVAYRDIIERGRHAAVALFLTIPPGEVDVNVHPTKAELRFAAPDAVRALVIGGLGRALGTGAGRNANRLVAFPRRVSIAPPPGAFPHPQGGFAESPAAFLGQDGDTAGHAISMPSARMLDDQAEPHPDPAAFPAHPLGAPVAQVLDTYIIAVAADGDLVLVDQHAAHERLTHERLRHELATGGIRAQALLLPEIVALSPARAGLIADHAQSLARAGIELEPFGPGAIIVRTLPASLGASEAAPLIRDIADELASDGISTALDERLDAVVARLACHGSIRAGRRLGREEMAALLRAMEATPRAATCSHGRPTYLKLTRATLERMFGRS